MKTATAFKNNVTGTEDTFVNQRHVCVSYVERKGQPYVNVCFVTINEENALTTLYVSKGDGNDILISRSWTKNSVARQVIGCNAASRKSTQHTLNLRGFVTKPGLYNFYRTSTGYRLELVRQTEPKAKPYVRPEYKKLVNPIRLNVNADLPFRREFRNKLLAGRNANDCSFVVEEFYHPTAYIRVRCVDNSEAENIVKGVPGHSLKVKDTMSSLTRKLSASCERGIHVSRYFREETGFDIGDEMNVKMEGDALIYEFPPCTCEICSRPVLRRNERFYSLHVCEDCSNAVKMLGKKTAIEGANFKSIKSELQNLNDEISALYDQMCI